MTPPVSRILDALSAATGGQAKRNGRGWSARCPAHDDHSPSLSVAEGDDGRALVKCFVGCSTEAIVSALGMTLADLMPDHDAQQRGARRRSSGASTIYPTLDDAIESVGRGIGECAGVWRYHDAGGAEVMAVARFSTAGGGKQFRPFHARGNGWACGDPPGKLPLYRLGTLGDTGRVFVLEGEKCADAARSIELVATTSAHGAKSAKKTDWTPLAGREVIILPDNDDAGGRYAHDVARLCSALNPPATVKVVKLPGLPDGGDIVDYLESRDSTSVEDIAIYINSLADNAAPMRSNNEAGASTVSNVRRCAVVTVGDVEPEPVHWLWPTRIALGKVTLLVGDPGLGKSFVTLDVTARVTSGRDWPDAIGIGGPQPSDVVILSAEDDVADTIRPRLDKHEADVSRVHAIQSVMLSGDCTDHDKPAERWVRLDEDIALVETVVAEKQAKLLIIDPISAYMGKSDSHVNAEVRAVLGPLSAMAARQGVAVLCVTHFNKSQGSNAQYRSMGSLAFTAAARQVWAIGIHPEDITGRARVMLPVKNNIVEEPSGLAFQIVDGAVQWSAEPVTIDVSDILREKSKSKPIDDATGFLRETLADGAVPTVEVESMAKAAGISKRTLDRARRELKVKPTKLPEGWAIHLPASDNGSKDATMP